MSSKQLTKEEEFLLTRRDEILASNETNAKFLDFLLEQLPPNILKNFDDNIDLLRALEHRTINKLTIGKTPPNSSRVGMYLKLVCYLGIRNAPREMIE